MELLTTSSYSLTGNIFTLIGTLPVEKAESKAIAAKRGKIYQAELLLGILRNIQTKFIDLKKKKEKDVGIGLKSWLD